MVKSLPANAGDMGSNPGLGRALGGENGNLFQDCCLGNSMDRRNLVGYRPQGHKELSTAKHTESSNNGTLSGPPTKPSSDLQMRISSTIGQMGPEMSPKPCLKLRPKERGL